MAGYYQPPTQQPKQDPYKQQNAMAAPMSPWAAQPKPASTAGSMTTQRNAFALPQGFDVRAGSQDPAINQQVYGNSFPGTVPGYANITNPTEFYNQTPQGQGDYRQALYGYNQRQQMLNPQGQGFQYDPQAYQQNPAYQSQLQESERALNRHLLSTGRSDSTGAANAFATNARRLGGEFEQQAYGRAGDQYQRGTQENERLYNRTVAEQILQQQQDQQYWERMQWLANAGFQPGPQ